MQSKLLLSTVYTPSTDNLTVLLHTYPRTRSAPPASNHQTLRACRDSSHDKAKDIHTKGL